MVRFCRPELVFWKRTGRLRHLAPFPTWLSSLLFQVLKVTFNPSPPPRPFLSPSPPSGYAFNLSWPEKTLAQSAASTRLQFPLPCLLGPPKISQKSPNHACGLGLNRLRQANSWQPQRENNPASSMKSLPVRDSSPADQKPKNLLTWF